jgi:Arylsulfotransferase (ASST)
MMFVLKTLVLSFALCMTAVKAWDTQSYKSVPFVTPVFNITKSGEPLAPGYLFLTTTDVPYPAAVIITDEGELVWSSQTGNYANLNVQTLDSKSVLTYWNGSGSPNPELTGHGYGKVQILDSTYTVQHSLCPDLGLVTDGTTNIECQADLHESYVTDRGSLLVTGYNITQADLTSVNGSSQGWVYDSLFFEIDIKTKEVLFSWSALESGIPLSASKQPLGSTGTRSSPYDFFHINAVQSVGNGYLVNSRHTWTTFKLDLKGEVEWRFEVSTPNPLWKKDKSNIAIRVQQAAISNSHRIFISYEYHPLQSRSTF